MSTINDTDQFLVQRGTTSYKQSAVDLMSTIQDTDLMLIQRGTLSYKVTCLDVKDQLGGGGSSPPVLDSVTLAQDGSIDANRFTSKSFTSTTTSSGGAATTLEMTGTVTGQLGINASTDTIQKVEADGKTLRMTSAANLTNGVFEVGDAIEQVGNAEFTSSPLTVVGTNIGNFTTYYTTKTNTTFNFASVYDGAASVTLININTGQSGNGGNGGAGGLGGKGGNQGAVSALTSTVASKPSWSTSDTSGFSSIQTSAQGGNSGVRNGESGEQGNIPAADPYLNLFAGYFSWNGGNGGGGGTQTSGSPGAGGGGNGGAGGVRFNKVSTPFAYEIDPNESNDSYLFSAPSGGSGTRSSSDGINGGPGGGGGSGWGAGGGGGGGNSEVSGTNSGTGSGGAGAPGIKLAAVTGTRYFDNAVQFTNATDVENVSVGQSFEASSGATGKVVAVDNENFVVLLDVQSGTISASNTLTFIATAGKGTINSINTDITPATIVIDPITAGEFAVGKYLVHQTPKPITVTPVTDSISGYDKGTKSITLSDEKDLIQFADGDAVYMSDASGTLVNPTFNTSAITNVAGGGAITYTNTYSTTANALNDASNVFQTDNDEVTEVSSSGGSNIFALPEGSYVIVPDGATMSIRYMAQQSSYFTPTTYGYTESNQTNRQLATVQTPRADNLSWLTVYTNNSGETAYIRSMSRQSATASGGSNYLAKIVVQYDGQTVVLLDGVATDSGLVNPQKTLTFTDNTDLDKFADGDVVRADINTSLVNNSQNFSAQVQGTSGQNECFKFGATISSPGVALVLKFSPAIPSGGQVSLRGNKGTNGSGVYFYVSINGGAADTIGGNGFQTWSSTFNGNVSSLTITTGGPNSPGNLSSQVTDVVINNQRIVDNNVPAEDYPTALLTDVTVVGTPTLNPPEMTVSGGTWNNGETVSITKSGTGTVLLVSPSTKTMVLSASNDQWVSDYHVATATKPAVATTAYLKFNAAGEVTGYQPTPVEPRAMDNKSNPTLTFPATFPDTGTAPDTEFPDDQAFIQTSVQLKNSEGDSATKASNQLVPQTGFRSVVAACECENNADQIKAMGAQIATHDQRVADHTAAKRQQAIADFEANLRRYSS